VGLCIAEISSKVILNDPSFKQKGNKTRNNKMRHPKLISQFYWQADDALDLHRWRKETKLRVGSPANNKSASFLNVGVTDPLCRSITNNLVVTEVESKL
jgi:hypothetical protein